MGLDSIELLMRFEREFKKDIPDQAAEQIATVGDMVNWLFQNLPIKEPDNRLKDFILGLFKKAFADIQLPNNFGYADSLKDFIPPDKLIFIWGFLEKKLHLKLPSLNPQDLSDKELKGVTILGFTIYKPKPRLIAMNFDRFVGYVGALNYQKLVDFDNLTSLFEITIAVMGITQEQSGVDIDEIFMDSCFSKDLGID